MHVTGGLLQWVPPFGNLRINAYLQLPEAYRSLSRPSSAPDAKAFPLRPFSLDHTSVSVSIRSENYAGFKEVLWLNCRFTLLDNPQSILLQTFLMPGHLPLCCLACLLSSLFSFQGAALLAPLEARLKYSIP